MIPAAPRAVRRSIVRGTSLALAAGLALGTGLLAPAADAAPAGSLRVTITDVSSPIPSPAAVRPLVVRLSLTNTTTGVLRDIVITGRRLDPLTSESALAAQRRGQTSGSPAVPLESGQPITTTSPVQVGRLAAGQSTTVVFRTTTGLPVDSGICLCANGVYPLRFDAAVTDAGTGVDQLLGSATTYLSSIDQLADKPAAVQVGWVWPLLDRPHRLGNGGDFLDDDLATSVTAGGRLARALDVAAGVAGRAPLTLVLDPELLDELQLMASGRYRVTGTAGATIIPPATTAGPGPSITPGSDASSGSSSSGSSGAPVTSDSSGSSSGSSSSSGSAGPSGGRTTSSTDSASGATPPAATDTLTAGAQAAATWLARLRTVLDSGTPQAPMQLALTPFGDPDVQSLGARGLSWSGGLPTAMAVRVATALGGRTGLTDLGWPASSTVSAATVRELLDNGTTAALLPGTALRGSTTAGLPRSAATVGGGRLPVALTSATIEQDAAAAVSVGGGAASARPALAADLVIQSVQTSATDPSAVHRVVIAAPRYVDADVDAAVAAILSSSRSYATSPTTLNDVLETAGDANGRLAPTGTASAVGLPTGVITGIRAVRTEIPTLRSLLVQRGTASAELAARALLAAMPQAAQRLSSTGWQTHPQLATTLAAVARREVGRLRRGVHLVRPISGTYTLASSNAPLPTTVENTLPYEVRVRVGVQTVNGLPGLQVAPVTMQVDPQSKRTLHLPAHIERAGSIAVVADLRTSSGRPLGDPLYLSVRSTVLGVVGLVMSVVAGSILLLAVLWRLRRRLAGVTS